MEDNTSNRGQNNKVNKWGVHFTNEELELEDINGGAYYFEEELCDCDCDLSNIGCTSDDTGGYEWYQGCCTSYLLDTADVIYFNKESDDDDLLGKNNMSIDDLLESKRS